MTDCIYITETGERVRERGGFVDVGLSPEAQAALGDLLHFQPPKIGGWVNAGDKLFVVEGTLTAAEFYAPISGRIRSCATPDASISDWLVTL
jgi:glycine cleavage system H protein